MVQGRIRPTKEKALSASRLRAMTWPFARRSLYSDQFVEYLNAAAVYSFIEGDLLLDLPVDSGTLRFRRRRPRRHGRTTAVASAGLL